MYLVSRQTLPGEKTLVAFSDQDKTTWRLYLGMLAIANTSFATDLKVVHAPAAHYS
jgi:hypothetical protein